MAQEETSNRHQCESDKLYGTLTDSWRSKPLPLQARTASLLQQKERRNAKAAFRHLLPTFSKLPTHNEQRHTIEHEVNVDRKRPTSSGAWTTPITLKSFVYVCFWHSERSPRRHAMSGYGSKSIGTGPQAPAPASVEQRSLQHATCWPVDQQYWALQLSMGKTSERGMRQLHVIPNLLFFLPSFFLNPSN